VLNQRSTKLAKVGNASREERDREKGEKIKAMNELGTETCLWGGREIGKTKER